MKGNGGGNYWKELLDLYATSLDYDPGSPETIRFFQIVQNKLHYASHGHTAAELILQRADAAQGFMGLKSFSEAFQSGRMWRSQRTI